MGRTLTDRKTSSVKVRPIPAKDRKSTRLNSSHSQISYAVFCLKKKNTNSHTIHSLKHASSVSLHNHGGIAQSTGVPASRPPRSHTGSSLLTCPDQSVLPLTRIA